MMDDTDDIFGMMPLGEYEREVNRRLWRRRLKAVGAVLLNPIAVLVYAHGALYAIFKLLGWSE